MLTVTKRTCSKSLVSHVLLYNIHAFQHPTECRDACRTVANSMGSSSCRISPHIQLCYLTAKHRSSPRRPISLSWASCRTPFAASASSRCEIRSWTGIRFRAFCSSYPTSDIEDSKVFTARRVCVQEFGPWSPQDDDSTNTQPVAGPSRWHASRSRLRMSWLGPHHRAAHQDRDMALARNLIRILRPDNRYSAADSV